jgi:DNA anti-recombination protein RmuC
MIDSEISKEDYMSWRNSYITKTVFKVIKEHRDSIKAGMCDLTSYLNEEPIHRGRRVGIIEGLDLLLNIDYEDTEKHLQEEAK